jgi:predicted nucleic acid-binding protein
MPTVIDASALAAVLYDEPEAPAVLAGCEAELIAPGLLPYEMASLCRTKMLRRPEEAQRLLDCHRSLSQVGVRLMEPDWDGLPQLAQRWALSVYDAAYLQIALREGAALVTLDARFAAAADAAAADAAAAPVPGRPPIL